MKLIFNLIVLVGAFVGTFYFGLCILSPGMFIPSLLNEYLGWFFVGCMLVTVGQSLGRIKQ